MVISTSSSSYSDTFVNSLGFEVPGSMVYDRKKKTHAACGMKSSVYASLIQPFVHHLSTFGSSSIMEALRVSLKNATSGHGSSFQQGGTFCFAKEGEGYQNTLAWREDYPGDWMQPSEILKQGCGIEGVEGVEWPDVLQYVIDSRNGDKKGGEGEGETSPDEKKGDDGMGCGDSACDLKTMRAKMKAKAEAEANK